MENLELTQEWDKVFPKSNKVDHQKITFHNRYGITLAADMYTPKNAAGKLSAIAVSGPFGAVKEQSSGLYAQTMAEFGFLTIAFDPSFTGESGGSPRYVASPDINTEDFCAAAARVLRWGGRFALVHRPERLSDLFCTLRAHGLEPKRLRFVASSAENAPFLALVEARRGGNASLSVEPMLFIGSADWDEVYFRT